jgi:hypothetical protein
LNDVPANLIRFFQEEEHARLFIAGEIRVGLLSHYRSVEGARRDAQEGLVSFDWNKKAPQILIDKLTGQVVGQAESNQNIHYTGSCLNPRYILCTSHPDVDKPLLKEKFGNFVVWIKDPKTLLERIKAAWQKHPWALDGHGFIAAAVYNKDGVVEADPYLIAPPHYSYCQKAASFHKEREFRYVLTCSIDVERKMNDSETLSVGDCSDILTLEGEPEMRLSASRAFDEFRERST